MQQFTGQALLCDDCLEHNRIVRIREAVTRRRGDRRKDRERSRSRDKEPSVRSNYKPGDREEQ